MRKLILVWVIAAFTFSVAAQNVLPDSRQPVAGTKAAKENAQQSVKKEEVKANKNAMQHERAEIKAKTDDLRVARLKQQHLQRTINRDKEELKKQKATTENLEEKIKRREKDLESLNDRIKENEMAISKLQSHTNMKASGTRTIKNTSD